MVDLTFGILVDHTVFESDVRFLLIEWIAEAEILEQLPFEVFLVDAFDHVLSLQREELLHIGRYFVADYAHDWIVESVAEGQAALAQFLWDEDCRSLSYIQKKYLFGQCYLLSRYFEERKALEVAEGFHDPQLQIDALLALPLHFEVDLAHSRPLWVDLHVLDLCLLKDVKACVLIRQLAQFAHY